MSRARRWASAPGLRFLLLGGLLFGVHFAYGRASPGVLRVDAALQRQITERFVLRHGRAPDARERAALIEQWATEEALVRQARELGLDAHDVVVRRRLVQDVEFLLEAEAPAPSEAALREAFEANPGRYGGVEVRTFSQVFVADPGEAGRVRAAALRVALADGAAATTLGDPSTYGTSLRGLSKRRMASSFGEELAEKAFALAPDRWSEPLRSALGWHLLEVVEVNAPGMPPFESVRAQVAADVQAEAREQALARGKRRLRGQYRVEVSP